MKKFIAILFLSLVFIDFSQSEDLVDLKSIKFLWQHNTILCEFNSSSKESFFLLIADIKNQEQIYRLVKQGKSTNTQNLENVEINLQNEIDLLNRLHKLSMSTSSKKSNNIKILMELITNRKSPFVSKSNFEIE